MYVYCNFYCPAKKNGSDPPLFLGWQRHCWRIILAEKSLGPEQIAPVSLSPRAWSLFVGFIPFNSNQWNDKWDFWLRILACVIYGTGLAWQTKVDVGGIPAVFAAAIVIIIFHNK